MKPTQTFEDIRPRILALLPKDHPAWLIVDYLEEDETCRDAYGNIHVRTNITIQDLIELLENFEQETTG